MTVPSPPAVDAPSRRTTARASLAAGIGNTVETYDYAVYGFLAAILAQLFFPTSTPQVALLSAFAVFGAAFVIRPLGALLFGPMADRFGRRPTLVASLLGMAVATALIGLLPTAASIGILAPVLLVLLRICQGLSAAGEYTTAVIFAAEYAPPGRKGALSSRVQVGSLAGLLLGALVVLGLNLSLTPEAMLSWGWRVPFLISLPLGVIGLYLRSRLGETPEFEAVREGAAPGETPGSESPNMVTDRRPLRAILLVGVGILHCIGFYLVFTYTQNAIIQQGLSPAQATTAVAVALVVGMALVVTGGRVSDAIGRPKALLASAAISLLVTYPVISGLTSSSSLGTTVLFAVLLAAAPSFYFGVAPITYTELFPIHARGRGVAITYNVTVAIFGGSAVYLSQWLVGVTGDARAPAFVLMAAAAIAVVAALGLRGVLVDAPDHRRATPTQATSV